MRIYNTTERKYITSKVKNICWESIPESLKLFWVQWKSRNN